MVVIGRAVIVLTVGLITACSGGTWVDVVFPGPVPSAAEFEALKTDLQAKAGFEMIARGTCSQAGKSYNGEMRLGKLGVQVKCK